MAAGQINLPEGFELETEPIERPVRPVMADPADLTQPVFKGGLPEGFEIEETPQLKPAPQPRAFEHFLMAEDRLLPPWAQATRREKAEKVLKPVTGIVTNVMPKRLGFLGDIFWALYKRIAPQAVMEETKGMNLDQTVNYLAGRDPSGLEAVAGGVMAFTGPVRMTQAVLPKEANHLLKVATEWGGGEAIIQLSRRLASIIDPGTDYGYEGATAVAESTAKGLGMGAIGTLPISKTAQVVGQSAVMAGTAALEGASPEEIITQAAIPVAFGAMDALKARKQMRAAVEKLREEVMPELESEAKETITVYHGSDKEGLTSLKPGQPTTYRTDVPRKEAVYVSKTPEVAKSYGKNVYTFQVEKSKLIPDEDTVFDILQGNVKSALTGRLRTLWSSYTESTWKKYMEGAEERDPTVLSQEIIEFTDWLLENHKNVASKIVDVSETAAYQGELTVTKLGLKPEAKEVVEKRLNETIKEIEAGKHDPPTTTQQAIGRGYGLPPTEVDRLLDLAERRYRELKLKPTEEREGQHEDQPVVPQEAAEIKWKHTIAGNWLATGKMPDAFKRWWKGLKAEERRTTGMKVEPVGLAGHWRITMPADVPTVRVVTGEKAELAFLSRNRGDIAAIVDDMTSKNPTLRLNEGTAAPQPHRSRYSLNNLIRNLSGTPDEMIAAVQTVTDGKYSDIRRLPKKILEQVADFVAQTKSTGTITEDDYDTPVNIARFGDMTMERAVGEWFSDPDTLKSRHRAPGILTTAMESKPMGWLRWGKDLFFGRLNYPLWHFAKVLDAGDETKIASAVFSDNFADGYRIESRHARQSTEMLLQGFQVAEIGVKDAVRYSRIFDRKKAVLRTVFNHLSGDLEGQTEMVPVDLGTTRAKLSWGEILSIYMLTDQPKGLEHIKGGGLVIGQDVTGAVTDQQIAALRAKVQADPKLMTLIDTFRQIDRTHWKPTLNEASRRINGTDIATEDNWWGFDVYVGKQIGGKNVSWIKNGSHYNLDLTENQSIFKDRTHSRFPLRVHDAFEQFAAFESAIARYVGMAEPLRIARTLLNHQPTYQKLAEKGYADVHAAMVERIKQIQSPARYDSVLDKLTEAVMPNLYRGLLNFSPTVWASNYSSVANYGSYVTDGYMPQAVAPIAGAGYRQLKSEVLEHSDIGHARYSQGLSSVEIGMSRESDIMLQATFGKSSYINVTGDVIREADMAAVIGGWNIAKAEFADAKTGAIKGKSAKWWGAEDVSAIKEGSPEYWDTVSRRAEYLWQRTQSTWDPYNRSLITGSPNKFVRSFFLFRSAHEKALTMIADAKNEYDNGKIAAPEFANRVAYPIAGYAANAVVGLAVDAVIFGVVKSPSQWVYRIATEWLAMFPLIGKSIQNHVAAIVKAISGEKDIWVDETTLDSLPVEVVNKTLNGSYKLTGALTKYIASDGKKGEKELNAAIQSVTEETAMLLGLPVGPVKKLKKGYLAEEKQ